jgi:hypothetical protein
MLHISALYHIKVIITNIPEDYPAGLKHVGGFCSEDNIRIVHLLVILTFRGENCLI